MPRMNPRQEPLRTDPRGLLDDPDAPPSGRLVRQRRGNYDKFHIPMHLRAEGMDYQWCRESVAGANDAANMTRHQANHWQAVDCSEMPGVAPAGMTGPFRQDGMVLCARPQYLSDEAHAEVYEESVTKTREIEKQMGVSNPQEGPRLKPSIKKTWAADGRIPVPGN